MANYLVKCTYNGANGKKQKTNIIVNGVEFEEIAGAVSNHLKQYGDYRIESVSLFKHEVNGQIGCDGEYLYQIKYQCITIDEVSAKERKTTGNICFVADCMDGASIQFDNWQKDTVTDYDVKQIKELKVNDII